MRQFVISDTHFDHENILKYATRPFKTVERMNEILIKQWNNIVTPSDVIFHLGDFGFGPYHRMKEIFDSLRGQKILILGNHDRYTIQQYYTMGWAAVVDALQLKSHGARLHLTHIPLTSNFPTNIDYVLHGHIHRLDAKEVENIVKPEQHINVCVEKTNYTPMLLETVVKKARKRCHN